jgi:hypothetical protein
MNNHASEEQRRQLVAEFRHSVVAELANPYLNHGELISSIREKANRVGSGNSGRPISGKSVRFGEEMNSDRLVADQCNEGKDDTNADTTRDPGIAERRPHPEGDR